MTVLEEIIALEITALSEMSDDRLASLAGTLERGLIHVMIEQSLRVSNPILPRSA